MIRLSIDLKMISKHSLAYQYTKNYYEPIEIFI